MALAVALSPSRATANSSSFVTTPTFNPPACLLVVCGNASAGTHANPTITMTNNGTALTWTQVQRATRTTTGGTTANNGCAYMAVAKLTSARTGMTLTATLNNGTSPISIKPYCVTGYDTSLANPWANALIGRATTNGVTTTAFTPSQPDSLLFAVADEWVPLSPAPTATNLTSEAAMLGTGPNLGAISGYRQLTDLSSQSVAFDAAGTANADWMWVTAEILAPVAAAGDDGSGSWHMAAPQHHDDELAGRRLRRRGGLYVPERRELTVCRAA